jgi:ribose-phosphate pyrophosphokinase
VNAAKLASAHRITAVMPWYGYSRQDKKSAPREPISAKLVADLLQAAGIDRLLTMDLHAGQIQGFFQVPVDHMTAVPMLADHFLERHFSADLSSEDLVVVSPDTGRTKLANHFREKLDADLAVLAKQRPDHNEAEILMLIGEVEGKTAILIDDMIDTAGTLCAAADMLRRNGATRVLAAATHGIFSGPAFDRLIASEIEEIVITDTVPLPPHAPEGLVHVLSVDRILADCIHNVFCDESVSEIFAGENQLF